MQYMNSMNIASWSIVVKKKKMGTCTFKLNVRENKILPSTGGSAICCHNAYFSHLLLFLVHKCLFGITDCSA